MKKITTFLFVCILAVMSCEENEISPISPTTDNFKLTRILNYASSTAAHPYGTVEFSYDMNGNLIKESTINYPNTLTTYKVYEYSGNKMTKMKIYDGQVGNLTLGTYTNYFYTGNKLTREELFLSDGTPRYTTFYEFEGDRLVHTYKVDDNLGIHHQYKYTFDILNRLTREEVLMYNQELEEVIKHGYDNLNRQIKSEFYNHVGELTSYVKRKYHTTSKLPMEEKYYDSNGTLTQTRQFTYDNEGNLTEINVIGQGTSCRLFKRTYKGQLLTEEIRYHPSFGCSEWTVTRYEYEAK